MDLSNPFESTVQPSVNPALYIPGPSTYAAAPTVNGGNPNTKRPKTGCITCRLRKKRCDEKKPVCATCDRLGIECLGYDKNRLNWLRTDESKKRVKQDLKKQIRVNRSNKARAAREGSDAINGLCLSSDSDQVVQGASAESAVPANHFIGNHNDQLQAFGPAGPTAYPSDGNTFFGQESGMDNPPPPPAQALGLTDQISTLGVSTALTAATDLTTTFPSFPNTEFEDVWSLIFGQAPAPPGSPAQLCLPAPSPTADGAFLSFFSPPSTQVGSPQPDLTYLHHYLNVVLPLQYRFVVKGMAELVAPLALNNAEILKSTSSLAALHLAIQRGKMRLSLPWDLDSASDNEENVDEEYAMTAHRQIIDRIRFVSAEELTSEEVVLPTLFAMSYYLFRGGTSRDWPDVLATSRRCLSAALSNSPEVNTGGSSGQSSHKRPSPWQRYRPLIGAMVWMDIVGSVSQNKASRLLPVYRSLLGQIPAAYGSESNTKLSMEKVMGCDDTTFLAIAETVQLSEWRDAAESSGCLSLKELLRRAVLIEKIMDERTWREDTLGRAEIIDEGERRTDPAEAIIPIMSEIFFGAAKVLLASVVHGPYPRVPEIAGAVQETAEALLRLDVQSSIPDVNRSLIFPITIAGVHAESRAQQTFFRNRFATLGPEAAAFGNSKQALQLLETVWNKRNEVGKDVKVCWRQTMRELGWESGILLI